MPIATFDLIPSDITTEKVFKFDYDSQEEQGPYNTAMAELKYDTNNAVLNFGSLFIFLSLKVAIVGLLAVMWLLISLGLSISWFTNLYTKLVEINIFNGILVMFLESYLEIFISSWLGIKNPLTSSFREYNGEMISYYLSYLGFGANILVTLTCIWVIFRPLEAYKTEEFKERWGVLTEDLRHTRAAYANQLVFCLRRLVFFINCFCLIENGGLQIVFTLLCNLLYFVYLGNI